MHRVGCPGCEALDINDPLARAHRLVDLHVQSGGYDHWGPLEDALKEAARRVREPNAVPERPYVGWKCKTHGMGGGGFDTVDAALADAELHYIDRVDACQIVTYPIPFPVSAPTGGTPT